MSMKSKDAKNLSGELNQPENGSGDASHSKRKLLKGIVTTAPVVMAISSKPALANFCTVSGFLSGNLSNPNSEKSCGGRSPGYYKSKHGVPHDDPTTFHKVFDGVWRGNDGVYWSPPDMMGKGTPTFYEVLNMGGNNDHYEFGAHAIAAYLNAHNIVGYGLKPEEVTTMVYDIITNGVYTHPGTGKTLDAQGFVYFITQTFSDYY